MGAKAGKQINVPCFRRYLRRTDQLAEDSNTQPVGNPFIHFQWNRVCAPTWFTRINNINHHWFPSLLCWSSCNLACVCLHANPGVPVANTGQERAVHVRSHHDRHNATTADLTFWCTLLYKCSYCVFYFRSSWPIKKELVEGGLDRSAFMVCKAFISSTSAYCYCF